jgi:hypothetical protein
MQADAVLMMREVTSAENSSTDTGCTREEVATLLESVLKFSSVIFHRGTGIDESR